MRAIRDLIAGGVNGQQLLSQEWNNGLLVSMASSRGGSCNDKQRPGESATLTGTGGPDAAS